jgi:hypothetical protein
MTVTLASAGPYVTLQDGEAAIVNDIETTLYISAKYLCDTSVRWTSINNPDCEATELAARWTVDFPFRLQVLKVNQVSASCDVEGAVVKNGTPLAPWTCTSVSRAVCTANGGGTPLSFAVGDTLSFRRTPSGCSGDRETIFVMVITRGSA